MEDTLDQAIELYCNMLPYINNPSQNGLDYKRLCKVTYKAYQAKVDTEIIRTKLFDGIKASDRLMNVSDDAIEEFVDKCILEIQSLKDVMDILNEFGALK